MQPYQSGTTLARLYQSLYTPGNLLLPDITYQQPTQVKPFTPVSALASIRTMMQGIVPTRVPGEGRYWRHQSVRAPYMDSFATAGSCIIAMLLLYAVFC